MRQIPLFDDIPADVVRPRVPPGGRDIMAEPSASRDEGPWLFAPSVVLRLELDEALEDGRFDDARQRYAALAEYSNGPERLASVTFLERLDASRLDGPLDELLRHWLQAVPWSREAAGSDGRRAWRGLVRRVLPAHGAAALVEACPACLAPLVNALGEVAGDAPSAALQARALVRDALLAGRELRTDDFIDRRVRDLLSEHAAPVWLASLGAIRRLWPAPAVDDATAATLLARWDAQETASDQQAARQFWDCLRIAWSPSIEDVHRHEARRRMKQLEPALHRLASGSR